MRYEVFRVMII